MRRLPLYTLMLWLALTVDAFAASGARTAGRIFGFLVVIALIVALIVWIVRRAGGRR